jgi:putative spermidine/putrescine transport system ATP-binding protein
MTVAENVAYGLEARGAAHRDRRARVEAMLALVRMERFADRMPGQLSGGQQQRIALARALAVEPRILLLDEPFGALDKALRLDMQIEIKRLQRQAGITSILVTHDQEEAMSVADRIAVLDHGRIEQFATPTETYDRPATLFVAGFVGTSNLLHGTIERSDEAQADVALDCGVTLRCAPATRIGHGARVVVAVRPERLRLARGPGAGRIPGVLRVVMPLGPVAVYEVETSDGTALKVSDPRDGSGPLLTPDEPAWIEPISRDACLVFPTPERRRL